MGMASEDLDDLVCAIVRSNDVMRRGFMVHCTEYLYCLLLFAPFAASLNKVGI